MELSENKYQNTPKKENPAFNPYLIVRRVILPFWPVYIIGVVAAYFTAKYTIAKQIPQYQMYAKLLLGDDNPEQALVKDLGTSDVFNRSVENEIQVLRSSDVTRKVAENIGANIQFIQKGGVTTNILDFNFPIILKALDNDSIRPVSNLECKFDRKLDYYTIDGKKYNYKDSVITINQTKYYIKGDAKTFSRLNPQTSYYLTIKSISQTAQELSNQILVSHVGNKTSILNISITRPNVNNGRQILNELLNVYTTEATLQKRLVSQASMDFIEDRLLMLDDEIDSVERKKDIIKEVSGIDKVSEDAGYYLSAAHNSDKEISEISLKLSILYDLENYIKDNSDKKYLVPSTSIFNEPLLNTLVSKHSQLQSEKTKLSKFSGLNDEKIQILNQELETNCKI